MLEEEKLTEQKIRKKISSFFLFFFFFREIERGKRDPKVLEI